MSDERGEMTLTGLLVAAVVFIVVLGATFDLFGGSQRAAAESQVRNETQDRVRLAADALARQLRNLASPTPDQPLAVERAQDREIVFKTVDPNSDASTIHVKRVRFCLDNSGVLWKQEQTGEDATLALPAVDTNCSGTAWNGMPRRAVAQNVVNYVGGQAVPVFTYNTTTPLSAITSVHVDLLVDQDTTRPPGQTRISTGVFLRNQNRAPSGSFTITQTATGLMLNGSLSSDPEGDPLTYCWYDTQKVGSNPPAGSSCRANGQYVGENVTYHYTVANGTSHGIWLEVRDSAGLVGGGSTTLQNVTKTAPA
jgi:hypothetical protein